MVKRNNPSIITVLRRYSKVITAFFVINFITSIVYPMFSFGSTEGPSTPEYSSFEPVEAGNMVDLNTGDFTYSVPLMEVPGPSGGFPLSLSYHAGIHPGEEASWVGMGWSLNPGAINRSVSGYPDDWKDEQSYTKEFWEGGETKRRTYGITVPITLIAKANLSYTQVEDTYRGVGHGWSIGAFAVLGIKDNVELSRGITIGQDPVSGPFVANSSGLSLSVLKHSKTATELTSSLSVNQMITNQGTTVTPGLGVNLEKGDASLIGASISINAKGVYHGVSMGGISGYARNAHHHNSGKVHSETNSGKSFNLFLEFPLSPDVTSYGIDEHQNDDINGALYPYIGSGSNTADFDNKDYDVVDLFEISDDLNSDSSINHPRYGLNNERMAGGALPAYDQYIVSGQGTGGLMQPFNYLQTLARQNKKNKHDNYILKNYAGDDLEQATSYQKPEFNYLGRLSNRYLYDRDQSRNLTTTSGTNPLSYLFHDAEIEADPSLAITKEENKVAQGENIEWFTNTELRNSADPPEVITGDQKGYIRYPNDKIGGFVVTNTTGVKYHYGLPVDSKNEISYSENINQSTEGKMTNETTKNAPYAYSWLITGMTGPDYVDRGGGFDGDLPNGILDEEDWGYWVAFDYGKWTDAFQWRSPGLGYEEDYDGNFKGYQGGEKEIYYLNAIRTSSHTALFVKDLRFDAKGLAVNERDASSYLPTDNGGGTYKYPTASLKLSEVLLYKNEDLPTIDYTHNETYQGHGHFGYNVLLSHNIEDYATAVSYATRTVDFETSYSLMPGSPNSFSNDGLYNNEVPPTIELEGKLTLDRLITGGKGGVSLIPPMHFQYEDANESYCAECTDYWGYYKSDYNSEVRDRNSRAMPSLTSAEKIDAWSLNSITSSLGAETRIKYSADTYSNAVIQSKANFQVKDLITNGDGTYGLRFEEGVDAREFFTVGEEVNTFLIVGKATRKVYEINLISKDVINRKIDDISDYYNTAEVVSVTEDQVDVLVIDGESIADVLPAPEVTSSGIPGGWIGPSFLSCDVGIPTGGETKNFTDFLGGEVYVAFKDQHVGGGLKVDQISVVDNFNQVQRTMNYDYTIPGTSVSSGETSYLPVALNDFHITIPERWGENDGAGGRLYAVNGWYQNQELCSGSWLTLFANNWDKFILGGLSLIRPIGEVFDDFDLFDLSSVNSYMDLNILANEDYLRYKRQQITGELYAKHVFSQAPGVFYSNVKVWEEVTVGETMTQGNNYTVYSFNRGSDFFHQLGSVSPKTIVNVSGTTAGGDDYDEAVSRSIEMKNLTGVMGSMDKVEIFSKSGNLIKKQQYHYLHDQVALDENFFDNYAQLLNDKFGDLGIRDEVFVSGKFIPLTEESYEEDDEQKLRYTHGASATVLKRSSYPMISIGQTDLDYRSGNVQTSNSLTFDFYTGSPLRTLVEDNHGNKIATEVIPAYSLDNGNEYPEFGPTSLGAGNKNLLSQEGATFTYQMNSDFDPEVDDFNTSISGLLDGSLQTWSDEKSILIPGGTPGSTIVQPGIYRKAAKYNFIGDPSITVPTSGVYPIVQANLMNSLILDASNDPDLSIGWQKNGEITLYNSSSKALEAMDINGNFMSTKMDLKGHRVLSTVANANYTEFAFSGAEDGDTEIVVPVNYGGNVYQVSGERLHAYGLDGIQGNEDDIPVHSGQWSIAVASDVGFAYSGQLQNGSTYRMSVWSSQKNGVKFSASVDGGTSQDIPTKVLGRSGGWHLHEALLTIDGSLGGQKTVVVSLIGVGSGTKYMDDFRIHPIDATMTAYVYNDWGELSHVLDQNNLYTYYEYDAIGRLKSITRETFNHGPVKVSETIINYARSND